MTFETSVPGVYAGGDVVNDGPSSIVKAAAAGKAIANSILGRPLYQTDAVEPVPFDTSALLRRRSKRERRVPAPQTRLIDRNDFDEVMLTYSEQQARKEAARCLDCDTFCSICVGVCPNLALQTYETEPFEVRLPRLRFENDQVHIEAGDTYRVRQPFQVAVLTDFCNECGNCTTFCPTSGRPYRDKPRLYLDRHGFRRSAGQRVHGIPGMGIDGRWTRAGKALPTASSSMEAGLHRAVITGTINPHTFEVEQAEASDSDRNIVAGALRRRCTCCCKACSNPCRTCHGRPDNAGGDGRYR